MEQPKADTMKPKRTVCGCIVPRVSPGSTEILLVTEDGIEWGIPKGGVEPDEQFEAAAIRETMEETGIPVKTVAFMGTFGRLSVWFALPLDAEQKPIPQVGEILDAKFFPVDRLPQIDRKQVGIIEQAVVTLKMAVGV